MSVTVTSYPQVNGVREAYGRNAYTTHHPFWTRLYSWGSTQAARSGMSVSRRDQLPELKAAPSSGAVGREDRHDGLSKCTYQSAYPLRGAGWRFNGFWDEGWAREDALTRFHPEGPTATVPGSVPHDLWQCGLVPDPYREMNTLALISRTARWATWSSGITRWP